MNDVYKMDDHDTFKGTKASVFMYLEAIIIYWPLYFNAFNDFAEISPDAVSFRTFVTYHMIFLPVFLSENGHFQNFSGSTTMKLHDETVNKFICGTYLRYITRR